MPCLQLQTNVQLDAETKRSLVLDASALLAKATGKPEAYCMTIVQDQQCMSLGGDCASPTAFLQIASIGRLGLNENKTISKAFCDFLFKSIHVPADRIYIRFCDVDASAWGWNGGTFA